MVLTNYTLLNIIAVVAFVFSIVYLFFKYRYTHWKNLGVPFLEPKFPFGNFKESVTQKIQGGQVLTNYYNEMKAKGNRYFGVYFLHNPSFVPVDIELIKSIMSRDFEHFHDRGISHDAENDPLSATLYSIEGQNWKNLRAKINPTFASGQLKKVFPTLVECSVELKDCLNESIRKSEPVNIKQFLVQYTTDVIGSCAFGIECNSFKNPDTQFSKLGRKIFSPAGLDILKMFFIFCLPPIAKLFKMRVTNKEVDTFYRNLVKETIEYREKHNITRNDFLQLLIQLKNEGNIDDKKLSMNELSAQTFIFFVAGFETSSTTMNWTLFELAQNQTIQNKLREEIVRVLKKHDGKITYDAIMQMHYMEQVVQESMRKHPPLSMLQRVVTSDYTIPHTNTVLKKGTAVIIPVLSVQRDPEFYPDPEKFDPDRFTDEGKASRPDYTWLPFGEGPRICIGLRFGMMQVKVGLCQLLLSYKFTLNPMTVNPPILDPASFISIPKDAILLNAERVANH